MIYLDNAATTRINDEVFEAMLPYLREQYGNPGGVYEFGRSAAHAVDEARGQVAKLIKADSRDQIIFTASGSEANAMIFAGIEDYLRRIGKRKIFISNVEHESVTKSAEKLCIKSEFDLYTIRVEPDCTVDPIKLEKLLTDDVGLVSVMYVNNETGAVNPIRGIARICKERGILFHTDCVQAVSSYPIDVNEIGCDFLTISAHKIHACKGTGALYVRDKELLSPIVCGGRSQEFGLRGGTENVPGIVAMGKACELLEEGLGGMNNDVTDACLCRESFRVRLSTCMRALGNNNGLTYNGIVHDGRSRILSLTIDGIDAETLIIMLGKKGVCVSAGSACNSSESVPSHVLLAMGIDEESARNTIRISFSDESTMTESMRAAEEIADCVKIINSIQNAG